MNRRRLFVGAAGVLVVGLLAGRLFLHPEVRIRRQGGDWRGVSEGFKEAGGAAALAGGERALVHLHAPIAGPAAIRLQLSLRNAAFPASLDVWCGGHKVREGPLSPRPSWIRVPLRGGFLGQDVFLQASAHGGVSTWRPLYLVHEIQLLAGERWPVRLWPWLPALFGLLAFGLVGGTRHPGRGFLGGALASALGAALLVTLFEPHLWLRFGPEARERLRFAGLVAVCGLGFLRGDSRLAQSFSIVALAGLLFLPTLDYGLVYDDFLWMRPWSIAEVASTFVGPEDPLGVSNPYYRPLPSTSHALDYRLYGAAPRAFHLTNVALRALTGIAALALFRRLGLSGRGALAGALVWVAHPLGASAVAWISQRTDLLAAGFSLAALAALAAPSFGRRQAVGALGLTLLALGSKEVAVVVPVLAYGVVRLALPPEERPRRLPAVYWMAFVALVYLGFWAALFPGQVAARVTELGRWRGFEPAQASFWLRLVPALFAPIFLPMDYAEWWRTPLRSFSPAHLLLSVLVGPAVVFFLKRSCRPGEREPGAALLGLLWPLVAIGPILGLRTLDLYRLGLLLCAGYGLVMGALVSHVERRSRPLALLLALPIVLWLAPTTLSASAAWGPGGFYQAMTARWNRANADWLSHLTPEMRSLFWRQVTLAEHARSWVAEGLRVEPSPP